MQQLRLVEALRVQRVQVLQGAACPVAWARGLLQEAAWAARCAAAAGAAPHPQPATQQHQLVVAQQVLLVLEQMAAGSLVVWVPVHQQEEESVVHCEGAAAAVRRPQPATLQLLVEARPAAQAQAMLEVRLAAQLAYPAAAAGVARAALGRQVAGLTGQRPQQAAAAAALLAGALALVAQG